MNIGKCNKTSNRTVLQEFNKTSPSSPLDFRHWIIMSNPIDIQDLNLSENKQTENCCNTIISYQKTPKTEESYVNLLQQKRNELNSRIRIITYHITTL